MTALSWGRPSSCDPTRDALGVSRREGLVGRDGDLEKQRLGAVGEVRHHVVEHLLHVVRCRDTSGGAAERLCQTGEVDLPPHSAISYAACSAEVEVDDETGEVRVTRLQQCYDVGRALNPSQVEGQIEGGAMMGLGLGILENCYPYYPSADHRGGAFGSYLAPGMEDMPQIDTIMIENPSVDGPYGAKGVGEPALIPTAPAILSAIRHATGVRITHLPATPDRVRAAILEGQRT